MITRNSTKGNNNFKLISLFSSNENPVPIQKEIFVINIIIYTVSIALLPPIIFALAFNTYLKRRSIKIQKCWLPLKRISY